MTPLQIMRAGQLDPWENLRCRIRRDVDLELVRIDHLLAGGQWIRGRYCEIGVAA